MQVSIYMPPLKLVKNVVERMKTLSNFVVGHVYVYLGDSGIDNPSYATSSLRTS